MTALELKDYLFDTLQAINHFEKERKFEAFVVVNGLMYQSQSHDSTDLAPNNIISVSISRWGSEGMDRVYSRRLYLHEGYSEQTAVDCILHDIIQMAMYGFSNVADERIKTFGRGPFHIV